MAVAIGLGLQGLGLSELTLNLIPNETKSQVEVDKWKPWAAVSAALVMATLYFSYAQAQNTTQAYAKRVKELTAVETEAKKYDGDEKAAIAGLPERKVLATRWSRIAHDRGKLTQVFNTLASLRTAEGKPFFGQENKIYLTGLHLSRMPLGTQGGLPSTPDREALKAVDALNGPKSMYAVLGKAGTEDPLNLPLEQRPDVPLIAVFTGELESGPNAIKTISALEELLKKMPEVKDVRIDRSESGPAYVESVPEYEWTNKLKGAGDKPGPIAAPTANDPSLKKSQYSTFSAVLRWNDSNDPDLEPGEKAAAPAKTAPKK